jgi:hypothetical protein
MAYGPGDGRHEIGKALARAGACLHEQAPAARLDLGDREQHLQLWFAVLIPGEHARQRALRAEQSRHQVGVVGRAA